MSFNWFINCTIEKFYHSFYILILALGKLRQSGKALSGPSSNITAILWTSDLVSKKHLLDYVNKVDYIVQIWTTGNNEIDNMGLSATKRLCARQDSHNRIN